MKQPFCAPSEALRRVLDAAAALPRPETEIVPLDEADGRIAAGTLSARMDQPPFDRSPFDGYALHSADAAGASRETPVTLPVTMKLYAGDAPASPLPVGCAARIMTGAPLPEGADCVLMQELTDSGEETVQLYAAMKPQQNVVFRGGDIAAGAVIAEAGTVLSPAHLGVLAGQGYAEVPVYKTLTVGVLATGSELLAPGEAWTPGKIYDANGVQNAARLRQLGFAVNRRHCSDDPEEIAREMRELLAECDAVITSGGVSVGQKDYLPAVLEQLNADILFAGVAQKPGSPMLAGKIDGKLVFCLSGNPFAAAATLEQYAVPALLRAAGRCEESCLLPRTTRTLTTGFSKSSKGKRYLRAKAMGGSVTIPGEGNAEAHSSGSLSAMIGCNCLVELPAGSGPGAKKWRCSVLYSEQKEALAHEIELKRPAVLAVSGLHNSGKTTLLEKLLPALRSRGLKVGIIKHDGHDFTPDVPGTDSYRLREAGAEGVAVYSGQRYLLTEMFRLTEQDLLALFERHGYDLVLLEGFKDSGWPKIEVVRKEISDTPVSFQPLAVVGDIPGADFGLEDAQALADWLVAQMPGL